MAIVAGAVAAHDPAATRPGAWLRAAAASWRRWLVTGLWVGVPALLVAAPWFLRNWRLYGDPLGMALARQTIDVRTTPWTGADTWWLLRGWFVSFWGKFGGAGHIPMAGWIYVLLAALSALAVVGLVRLVIARRPQFPRDAVWVLLLALGGVALVMWRYSLVALGTDQGRLLFPAVGAPGDAAAAGWLALIPLPASGGDGCDRRRIGRGAGSHGWLGVIRPCLFRRRQPWRIRSSRCASVT
ncbi:MAG: hypothetical protein R2851_20880 [Caldilineaceae bacterium]